MFMTFSSNSGSTTRRNENPALRSKRSQVARACDWCRLNRIKCDDSAPCRNCQNKGVKCIRSRSKDFQNLLVATRENKHLESRLKHLEEQLKQVKAREAEPSPANQPLLRLEDLEVEEEAQLKQTDARETVTLLPATPSLSLPPSSRSTTRSRSKSLGTSDEPADVKTQERGSKRYFEDGLSCVSYRGLSSIAYFVAYINSYLEQSLDEPYDATRLQSISASTALASPASTLNRGARPEFGDGGPSQFTLQELDRPQEEMFLNLFWHQYHLQYPIVSEAEFEKHYESLWTDLPPNRSSVRRSSPLIDAMMAVCMQHGAMIMVSHDDEMDFDGSFTPDDASIAGRGYYARCQKLLEYDLETPSITILQCLIFSTLFLWDASFVNQADNMLAVTVRVAGSLGVNEKPAKSLEPGLRILRRRLWWAIYMLDTKISIAVGRPFLINAASATCPSDEGSDSYTTGSQTPYFDQNDVISPYDYFTQCSKLALAVRYAFGLFEDRFSEFLRSTEPTDIQRDPKLTEELASLMPRAMRKLEEWTEEVPTLLKSNSLGGNKPFSPHRSVVEIDHYQPVWLQKQRICLILQYHEYAMLLARPFIHIPPTAVSLKLLSDGVGMSCLKHSMAITSIIQQVLGETDILKGCHQAYRTQWNATLSILGWVLANPLCAPTPAARKALQTSASIFDAFGSSVAFAKSAAAITRDISALIQTLIPNVRSYGRLSIQQGSSALSKRRNAADMSLPPLSSSHPFPGPLLSPPLGSPPQQDKPLPQIQPSLPPTPSSLNSSATQHRPFQIRTTHAQDFTHDPITLVDEVLNGTMGGLWPGSTSMSMTVPPSLLSIDPQLTDGVMPEVWDNTTDVR